MAAACVDELWALETCDLSACRDSRVAADVAAATNDEDIDDHDSCDSGAAVFCGQDTFEVARREPPHVAATARPHDTTLALRCPDGVTADSNVYPLDSGPPVKCIVHTAAIADICKLEGYAFAWPLTCLAGTECNSLVWTSADHIVQFTQRVLECDANLTERFPHALTAAIASVYRELELGVSDREMMGAISTAVLSKVDKLDSVLECVDRMRDEATTFYRSDETDEYSLYTRQARAVESHLVDMARYVGPPGGMAADLDMRHALVLGLVAAGSSTIRSIAVSDDFEGTDIPGRLCSRWCVAVALPWMIELWRQDRLPSVTAISYVLINAWKPDLHKFADAAIRKQVLRIRKTLLYDGYDNFTDDDETGCGYRTPTVAQPFLARNFSPRASGRARVIGATNADRGTGCAFSATQSPAAAPGIRGRRDDDRASSTQEVWSGSDDGSTGIHLEGSSTPE